jgi:hypothetical protein
MVTVAQLVESLTVTQVVAGSSPVSHPIHEVVADLASGSARVSGANASSAAGALFVLIRCLLLSVHLVPVFEAGVELMLEVFVAAVE